MAEAEDRYRSGRNPVRPYRALDTAKRRRAGGVYLVMAAGAGAFASLADVPLMWTTAALPIAALAIYQYLGGWRIEVTDMDAIEQAGGVTSFAVGHGSATLGFRGLRAKPVWQVLVFGDGPAPEHQALVTIDAVSGDVTGLHEEDVGKP